MRIGSIDLTKEVLIIAEIGNNHEGDIEVAKKMISLAAKSGVQAVKFQTIVPEKLVSSDQTNRIEQLKKFQFSYDQYRDLKSVCDNEGVMFLSTPFDLESATFLNELVPAFKIASGDNAFYPLLSKVAETGKPIILSTGMSTSEDVAKSADVIRNTWKEKDINDGLLVLLHCNVSYPTPPEDVNLGAITALKEYADLVGYSDHTLGVDAAIASVAFGARVIEKHFTYDKSISTFRDHQLSADPDDLRILVEKVRLVNEMMGTSKKYITKSEAGNAEAVRRSIALARDMKKGEEIGLDDIMWVRPGTGIKPGNEEMVIGKSLKRDYKSGMLIDKQDLEV